MTKSPKNQRKRLIINPRFQWPFVASILQLEIVVFLTAALITLIADYVLLDLALLYSPHFQRVTICAVGLFLLCGAILVQLGLRISNRISGPLYRISMVLDEIVEGRVPKPIRFREGDFHPELADKVNRALEILREHRDSQARAWSAQAEQVQALIENCEGELADTLRELARSAQASGFKSTPDEPALEGQPVSGE
ncbi:hypothetical protein JXA47_04145 [Candidatus Sumerlaeota bacterium]|nr:hypothetical protein [Candidatus Sumerlaeota bacterium]